MRPARSGRPRARIPVTKRTRRALLALHIITAVGLLGADAGVLALVVRGIYSPAVTWAYPAAAFLGTWVLQPLAVTSLLTGLLQGITTPWGVLTYWWTTIKLTLNTVGLVLAVTVLAPTLHQAAAAASSSQGGSGLIRDSAAASSVLIATVLISTFKPLGRLKPASRSSTR